MPSKSIRIMWYTMHILAVAVYPTNQKTRNRLFDSIRMANSMVWEFRRTPRRARYKAHIDRIATINIIHKFCRMN